MDWLDVALGVLVFWCLIPFRLRFSLVANAETYSIARHSRLRLRHSNLTLGRGFAALWLFSSRRQALILLAHHRKLLRCLTFELSRPRRQVL